MTKIKGQNSAMRGQIEVQVSPNCPRRRDTSKGRFEPKRGHSGDTLDTFQGFLSRAHVREEIGKKCPNCPYCPCSDKTVSPPTPLISNQFGVERSFEVPA